MSEKKPLDKKPIRDLLTEKDAFLTTSEKLQEYFLRHTKGVIITIAAVALAVIAAAVYMNHQAKAEKEAALAYENSLTRLAGSEDDGIAALEKVRGDFAGRKASRLAAFRLLGLYVAKNDTDKALPLAEDLLKTIKPAEASLKPALLSNLGGLYEEKQDYQQAAKSYETLLAMNHLGPNLQQNLLMSLGRVYTSAGRKDDAVKNYERLIREYPMTLQAFMANAKLAELKGEPVAFPLPTDDPVPVSDSGSGPAVEAEESAVTAPPVEDDADESRSAEPASSEDAAESGGSSPIADDSAPEQADDNDIDVDKGAPLPPNVAPTEDHVTPGEATSETGAE